MILLFLLASAVSAVSRQNDNWFVAGRLTGMLLQDCMRFSLSSSQHRSQQQPFLGILQRCLEHKTLLALDRVTEFDTIVLTEGIAIVKCRTNENQTISSSGANRGSRAVQSMAQRELQDTGMENDWENQVFQRVAHVFSTHVLKIDVNAYGRSLKPEGRRRRRHMMASLMMFGIVAVGLIMIPMGFQFLAVLGGKALLLAKMALLLTSIQGLKKIATSNLNYGLYAAPGGHTAYGPSGHYERQWPFGTETHDINAPLQAQPPFQYYGNIPDQQTDMLHPLQPRIDHFRDHVGGRVTHIFDQE